jgi:hypothetical protein
MMAAGSDMLKLFSDMETTRAPEPSPPQLPAIFERPLIEVDELLRSGIIPLGRNSLYRAVAAGDIPSVRIGRNLFIKTRQLREMLDL